MHTERSGEIDILRFLFSLSVMLFHFGNTFKMNFFTNGYIGVEFFFVVTGYLTARHAAKKSPNYPQMNHSDIAEETWNFIIKKVGQFYRYYISAVFLRVLVLDMLIQHQKPTRILRNLIRGIPVYTMTFMALKGKNLSLYVSGTWYVSAMVIALFMLYPFLFYRYSLSTKWLFPILSLFLLGYLYIDYSTISDWKSWTGIAYTGVLRAIAEIACGTSLYALSEWRANRNVQLFTNHTMGLKLFLTIIKVVCFGLIFVFARGSAFGNSLEKDYDLYMLFICMFGIFLCFDKAGFCLPDNRLTRYLGKTSVAIYFFHGVIRTVLAALVTVEGVSCKRYSFYLLLTVVLSIALLEAVDVAHAFLKKTMVFRPEQ